MMNATKSKYVSWSNGVGLLVRQWRVSIAIAVGGMAMLGIALATSQAMPLRGKKSEMLVSISAKPQSTLLPDLGHNVFLSADLQPQTIVPAVTPDVDLEVIHDFVLDGLEFAVAGAEVTNQFGPYRQIGNTVSWLTKELSQSEEVRFVASKQPKDAGLAAYPLPSPTEKEMATWLMQNSPWAR